MSVVTTLPDKVGQYGYNGILIGTDTSYTVESVEGLLGIPGTQSSDIAYGWQHGSSPGILTMPRRVLTVSGWVVSPGGGDGIETAIRNLVASYQPPPIHASRTDFHAFTFTRPGEVTKCVYARVTSLDIDTSYAQAHGVAEFDIKLEAVNPYIYRVSELSSGPHVIESGQSTLATFDITLTGNNLNGTPPRIVINGPALNPYCVIKNVNSNAIFTVTSAISITGAQFVELDLATRTSTTNGGDGWYYGDGTAWPSFEPGVNEVTIHRDPSEVSADCDFTFHYRETWL